MKKHLIAAAVAAAVAAPAMAQNVSISGVFDSAVSSIDKGTSNVTSTKGNVVGTSQLNFKASEDLGGGLKAAFALTQEFSAETGARTDFATNAAATYGGSGNNIDAGSFQEASLALSGSFGEVRLGHTTLASRDASGVGRFGGNFGRLSSAIRTNGDKVDNAIQYTSPNINGLTIAYGYANGAAQAAAVATPVDTGLFVKYEMGKFTAAIGQSTRDVGLASDNKETVIGAQYDLGVAKIGVVRGQDNGTNAATDSTALSKLTGTTYQVAAPMAGGLTLIGGLASYKNSASTVDAKGYSLMVQKALSKRTTVYGYVDSLKNKGTVAISASTATGVAGQTTGTSGVGILHSF